MTDKYQVLVIGAGPGGYVAAIRAAQLGFKTACIDKWLNKDNKPALGGTCLNVGCIPSKALLESSGLYSKMSKESEKFGIKTSKVRADIPAIIKRKDKIVSELTSGIATLFKANKIAWLKGAAKVQSKSQVLFTELSGEEKTLQADNIIIAAGSVPIKLKNAPLVEDIIVDSEGALNWQQVPEELIIIGAGVIGLELGSVWSRLGANVTIIEGGEFLPFLEPKISKTAAMNYKRQGLNILTSCMLDKMQIKNDKVLAIYKDRDGKEHNLTADKAIVAVGRRPLSKNLVDTASGIELDAAGRILVDDYCATGVSGIYAIGDVVRGPMLAHKASEEGVMVAERIAGKKTSIDYNNIPFVIYTHPEIAWVGKTESELKSAAIEFTSGEFAFAANGRAKTAADTVGFVKIIADKKTDRILGVHIIGPEASELIGQAVISMEFQGSSEDLARSIFAHPTLSESLHEAALAVDNRALHSVNRKPK